MRRRMWVVCAAVVMSGCYHVTVVTGAPESSTRIDNAFQMSYVAGLVPPSEIRANQDGCTNGVAKVETWRSFVNMLIGGLSSSLITPISVRVTCSAGLPLPDASTPSEDSEPSSAEGQEGAAEDQEAREPAAGG